MIVGILTWRLRHVGLAVLVCVAALTASARLATAADKKTLAAHFTTDAIVRGTLIRATD